MKKVCLDCFVFNDHYTGTYKDSSGILITVEFCSICHYRRVLTNDTARDTMVPRLPNGDDTPS